MNIFLHELKSKLGSILIWSISIFGFMFVVLALSSTMTSTDSQLIDQMMASFPEELLIAFGMTNMDLTSIMGFYAFAFLFIQICLGIQAANYGFGLVSIEESEFTADFLLAKPVSRQQIITSKLLAAVTGLLITNLAVWASSFIFIEIYKNGAEYSTSALLVLLSSIAIFQAFFLTVGLVISLLAKRVRSVTPYSMGLVFGLYILNTFGGMIGDKNLEVLSPFKQFDANYILKYGEYDFPLMMISVAIVVIAMIGSYLLYSRRNIPSAV